MRTRRLRLVAVASVLAVTAGGIGISRERSLSQMCRGGAVRMRAVWAEDTRGRLRGAFAASEAHYASETWDRVESALDGYTQRWAEAHDQACAATHVRREQSASLLDLRMSCLREREVELAGLIEAFADPDERVVRSAIRAVGQLSPIESCGDVAWLTAQIRPPEDPTVAREATRIREVIARSRALELGSRFARGRAVVEAELDAAVALDYPPLLAELWLRIGFLRQRDGDNDGAITGLENAYYIALACGHTNVGFEAATGLAFFTGALDNDHATARRWVRSAEALMAHATLEGTVAHARLLNNAGSVEKAAGNLATAEEHHRRSIEIWEAVDPESPSLAMAYGNLANALAAADRFEEALRFQLRAVELGRHRLGPTHPNLGLSLNSLGNVYVELGRQEEGTKAYRAALATFQGAFGSDHFYVAGAMTNVARALSFSGDLEGSREHNQRALELIERNLGREHPHVAYAELNLCRNDLAAARPEAARPHCLRALEIRRRALGPDHPETVDCMAALARVELHRGQVDDARAHLENALEHLTAGVGSDSSNAAMVRTALGHVLLEAGDLGGAERELEAAVRILTDNDHGEATWARRGRAEVRLAQGRAREALEDAQAAYEAMRERPNPDYQQLPRTRLTLARALVAVGEDPARAEALVEQSRRDAEGWPTLAAEVAGWPQRFPP